MTATSHFQTNYEGSITLEQLAESVGCSLKQFLGDSVLSIMLCIEVAVENRLEGKLTPTMLLFEREDGEGYETYDVMEALIVPSVSAQRFEIGFLVSDPIAEGASVTDLPLSDNAIFELNRLSRVTSVSPHKLLEEGINLRWMLKQAADKSLDVLLDSAYEHTYIDVPTTFID